jgi:hypothetical protein
MVYGLGFRVQGLKSRLRIDHCLGFMIEGLGFRDYEFEFWI